MSISDLLPLITGLLHGELMLLDLALERERDLSEHSEH